MHSDPSLSQELNDGTGGGAGRNPPVVILPEEEPLAEGPANAGKGG